MTTDSTKGTRYDGTLSGELENEVTILSGSKGNTSGSTHGGSKGGAPSSGGKGGAPSTPSGNGGNWPSSTGQPSGGGRGNNAPKR